MDDNMVIYMFAFIFRNEVDYFPIRNYIESLESRSDDQFFKETRVSPNSFSLIQELVENYVGPNPPFSLVPYGIKSAVHASLH